MRARRGNALIRTLVLLAGVMLVLAGVAVAATHTPWWPQDWPELAADWGAAAALERIDDQDMVNAAAALAAVLAVLVVVALVAWARRLRTETVRVLDTAGTRAVVEPGAVAAAAQRACASDPQIRKADLRFIRERTAIVLEGTVTIEAAADLDAVSEHVARVAAQAAQMVRASSCTGRIDLAVARRDGGHRRID
ncbi:hypothetical protein [Ruania halotolerans]|uniref:hypothetical protein n=1 Tax=Ruania halotolerans TaxID=2897773 RepID=UPI001E33BE07|nr:hypothetical protein [Ruania halotolerans]UFU06671.1 hypothetical protein LQF10_00735 [Ruania halotolerans]